MKVKFGICLFVMTAFFSGSAFAQRPETKQAKAFATAAEIPYDSTQNFLKLPSNMYLGEGIGIATNSKGHIFTYTRGGDTSHLYEFDQNGTFVREIGHGVYGFAMAHAVRVDPQDNLWVVDEGTDTVMKFNPEGRITMVMGRRPEAIEGFLETAAPGVAPAPAQPYKFGRPTDVAWDKDGNIFISDGYTNSRVVKYDKNGKFIRAVGSRGTDPSQLNTPHGIAVDATGNVYVADRGNSRIQVFSSDLTLRAIYDHVGSPWAVCITPGPHQYLYSSNSYPDNNIASNANFTGEIYKMELNGTVVGKFGKAGKQLGGFSTVHAIDCRNENKILIGEITSWRFQQINLHPQGHQNDHDQGAN